MSWLRLHWRLSQRGALFGLAIAGSLAALLVDAHAPTALPARVTATVATLAALLLLPRCAQSADSRWNGLLALLLLVCGTRLLDLLTNGQPVRELVTLALGSAVAVIWWENRGRSDLRTCAAAAALAGAAAALSLTSLALLLLPTVEIVGSRALSAKRRVASVTGLWLLFGLALAGTHALVRSVGAGEASPACPGQGGWVLLVKLFSSHAGLLSASPLLWLGFAGWLCCRKSERRVALTVGACWLLACLLVWADPSASGGFEGLVPLLGMGLGFALSALVQLTRRWPLLPVCAVGVVAVLWNLLLMAQYRGGVVPRDDTVAFANVVAGAARTVTRLAGAPVHWPGNWFAAWRYGVPIDVFDRLVGLALFDPPGARQAALAVADPSTSALLLEGWGSPRSHSGRVVRRIGERARVIVPLACVEPLDVVIVAAGHGALTLSVNDARVGGWVLDEAFQERRARVSAEPWRCPVSTVTLEGTASGEAWIDSLVFVRPARGAQ
jgi:hypothetical protein